MIRKDVDLLLFFYLKEIELREDVSKYRLTKTELKTNTFRIEKANKRLIKRGIQPLASLDKTRQFKKVINYEE